MIDRHNSLISDAIKRYTLFDHITHSSANSHEIYLILHQIIPQSYFDFVNSFTFNMKKTRKIIFKFLFRFNNIFIKLFGLATIPIYVNGNAYLALYPEIRKNDKRT